MQIPMNEDDRVTALNAALAYASRLGMKPHETVSIRTEIGIANEWSASPRTNPTDLQARTTAAQVWGEGVTITRFLGVGCRDASKLLQAAIPLIDRYSEQFCRGTDCDLQQLMTTVTDELANTWEKNNFETKKFEKNNFEYQTPAQFRTYIKKLTRWRLIDWIKRGRYEGPPATPCDFSQENEIYYNTDLKRRIEQTWSCLKHANSARPLNPQRAATAKLARNWFIARYFKEMSNNEIARRDLPDMNSKAAVERISARVSRVRDLFCVEFVAICDQPAQTDALMLDIFLRWKECPETLGIPKDLACYLLSAAGILPPDVRCGPGR